MMGRKLFAVGLLVPLVTAPATGRAGDGERRLDRLTPAAQKWVNAACSRSLGPALWSSCIDRESAAAEIGKPDVSDLDAQAQSWLARSCSDSLGPSLAIACLQREADALRSGLPDLSRLSLENREWVLRSCSRSLGPSLFKSCVERESRALPSAAPAVTSQVKERVVGIASVIDGDTIDIHGSRFRLQGIDAPESDQVCFGGSGSPDENQWPCGRKSAMALDALTQEKTVACEVLGLDKYGRNLGRCSVDGVDVADWMARNGWAVAYRQYSMDYVAAEDEARTKKLNMWAGRFEAPRDWRHRKRGQ